ncbi:DUF4760 domain-containing protein, partial [Rhodovulum sulfidophilum]
MYRFINWFAWAILASLAATLLWHVYSSHIVEGHGASTAVAFVGVIAAIVALLSLFVQSALTRSISRKQHTMNVLFQSRVNSVFAEHVDRIQNAFPEQTPLNLQVVRQPQNAELFGSVRWVLR